MHVCMYLYVFVHTHTCKIMIKEKGYNLESGRTWRGSGKNSWKGQEEGGAESDPIVFYVKCIF